MNQFIYLMSASSPAVVQTIKSFELLIRARFFAGRSAAGRLQRRIVLRVALLLSAPHTCRGRFTDVAVKHQLGISSERLRG